MRDTCFWGAVTPSRSYAAVAVEAVGPAAAAHAVDNLWNMGITLPRAAQTPLCTDFNGAVGIHCRWPLIDLNACRPVELPQDGARQVNDLLAAL